MKPLFAYATPDQVMGLASGLATIAGVLLMFWNKVLVTIGKIINRITGRVVMTAEEAKSTSDGSSSK
ncbi:MAG TPA: hypothetical protein VEG68_14900 [Terriglobales bacterium]|nr:hypothetical protein [Terriglobales bacterium]